MNSALTRSAWVCSGNRRPAPSAAGSSGLRLSRDRVRLARADPNDRGHRCPGRSGASGSGQPRRHQPVLGLGQLHHQPRDPGRGGGLEQRPHGLRFPRSGRAADEHVPVQRVQRQRQRPGRAAVPVQDLADGDRRAAGRGLLGHVEIGPQRQPDARHLALGRLGTARRPVRCSRRTGGPPPRRRRTGWLRRVRTFKRLPQAAGRVAVGRDRVGQAGQVGGGAHQASHPGGGSRRRRRPRAARSATCPTRRPCASRRAAGSVSAPPWRARETGPSRRWRTAPAAPVPRPAFRSRPRSAVRR